MRNLFFFFYTLALIFTGCQNLPQKQMAFEPIQPYKKNPHYWEYKGEPVLLIGGSDDDNLFQWPAEMLIPHLDAIQAVGGNYVRNTMSDRKDRGFELYPFQKLGEGKYDLRQWNEEYWDRFSRFLKETHQRDIIVQIEVWDRFDYSRNQWTANPYNPNNNVNYTFEESGFKDDYPNHPNRNEHPFFFTTPSQRNNKVVFTFQEAFVKKMLSVSLQYDHVLYCMDNETSGEEAWGAHWADFIRKEAGSKRVFLTEMWDDKKDLLGEQHLRTYNHPDRYDFIDISQNSWAQGQTNWKNSQLVMDYIQDKPRPVNSVKIYGNDESEAQNPRSSDHAVETFFRNLLGGFASSRFHRPASGLGLSEPSIQAIKSIRSIEKYIKFWEVKPAMGLLQQNGPNEAYLAMDEGKSYLVYFPAKGEVQINFSANQGSFHMRTLNLESAEWRESSKINGGRWVNLASDYERGCMILLTKE